MMLTVTDNNNNKLNEIYKWGLGTLKQLKRYSSEINEILKWDFSLIPKGKCTNDKRVGIVSFHLVD